MTIKFGVQLQVLAYSLNLVTIALNVTVDTNEGDMARATTMRATVTTATTMRATMQALREEVALTS